MGLPGTIARIILKLLLLAVFVTMTVGGIRQQLDARRPSETFPTWDRPNNVPPVTLRAERV